MRRPAGASTPGATRASTAVLRWQYVAPAAIVVLIILAAFGIQPPGAPAQSEDATITVGTPTRPATSSVTPTSAEPSATAVPSATVPSSAAASPSAGAGSRGETPSVAIESVAGAVQTPASPPEPTPDLSGGMDIARCGDVREASVPLSVEQNIASVAVRATNAAVYPVDYLRCILLATGGSEAVTLANAIAQAGREGATHAALVDLWIANGNRDFAQLNLRDAEAAAAGETYEALGVLNGRGEVVVAGGQSRTVTLVVTLTASFGGTPGPITVSIEAPAIGGQATKGKYQLFLPTP